MSKYALKLEQLVQTDAYGDILITIQYDGQGPKLVTANGEGLNPEIKHTLDTILGLVNFTLAKGIPPVEVGDQLEAEPQDGVHLPINDVLLVIAGALKEAPEGISKIGPDLLMQIAPEMIKEFTQGVSGGEFENPAMPTPQPAQNPQPKQESKPSNNQSQRNQNSQPKQEEKPNSQNQQVREQMQRSEPKQERQNSQPTQNSQPKQEKSQEDDRNENQRGGFFGGFNR